MAEMRSRLNYAIIMATLVFGIVWLVLRPSKLPAVAIALFVAFLVGLHAFLRG